MKQFVRLYALAMIGVAVVSLCGCGQQESNTINKGDGPPAMGKTASPTPTATPGAPASKPKMLGAPPP